MRSRAGGAVRWVEPVCTAFRRDGTAPGREARARPPEAGRGGSKGEGRAGHVNVHTRARTHTRTHTPPESGCPARLRARRGPGWTAVGSRARPCPSLSRAIGRSGLSGGSRGPRTSGHGQTRRTWLLVSDSHGSGHTVQRWLRRDGRRNGRGERGASGRPEREAGLSSRRPVPRNRGSLYHAGDAVPRPGSSVFLCSRLPGLLCGGRRPAPPHPVIPAETDTPGCFTRALGVGIWPHTQPRGAPSSCRSSDCQRQPANRPQVLEPSSQPSHPALLGPPSTNQVPPASTARGVCLQMDKDGR